MILLSHPTGNANVRAVIRAFETAGILDLFCTSLGVSEQESSRWKRLCFQKRLYPVHPTRMKLYPLRETVRMVSSRVGHCSLIRHETGWASIDSVYRHIDRQVSMRLRHRKGALRGVYCYEDGALETFRTAGELGLQRFYDLPIAYSESAQRLLHEEAKRLPAWEPTLGGTRDSVAKLKRKADELELAEVVICPSRFAADSIPEPYRPGKRIVIAPFGSPALKPRSYQRASFSAKLRVLFAGSMSQRKGLGDLFAAMHSLKRNDVELVVMGSPQASMEFYRKEFHGFSYEPCRPNSGVLDLMRSCDVFCLPSIVEGRALVMQEAMSQGLPLIITPNTGGEDLIIEGVTGFLVPVRCPAEIASKIAWFADNRPLLSEMSHAAQAKASQFTWERYGQTIVETVQESGPFSV